MKKIYIILGVFAVCLLFHTSAVNAQNVADSTMAPTTLDAKTQKKVDQAKEQIAKDQDQLAKETEKYQKELAKFEKDKRKGKLTPIKEEQKTKDLDKASAQLGKLKQRIAENEALLAKYKQ